MGLSRAEGCEHPMPDAGRACTDSSQCRAACLVGRDDGSVRAGQTVTGVCAPTDYPFGCHQVVEHGVAAAALCVD